MAHCSYPYPNEMQTMEAASNLFSMLVGGQPRDLPCMIHCGYTLEGFGLSKGFPHDPHPIPMASCEDLEKSLAEDIKPLAETSEHTFGAVVLPWGKIMLTIQALLQIWLSQQPS